MICLSLAPKRWAMIGKLNEAGELLGRPVEAAIMDLRSDDCAAAPRTPFIPTKAGIQKGEVLGSRFGGDERE